MAGGPDVVSVPCSSDALASAISGASSGETIALAQGCAYRLWTALPNVTVSMKIVGLDTELLGYRPRPNFPLLTVSAGANLTVVNVDFKDGGGSSVDGGAIYEAGDSNVTVDGGIFTDNYAGDGYGGAVSNYGSKEGFLTVNGALFVDNDGAYYGGAIYNYGTTIINGSTFNNNISPDEEGGAIYNEGTMTINTSTFTGNSSYDGGAIYSEPHPSSGTLTLNRDTITGNRGVYGGGLYVDDYTANVNDSVIEFNIATDDGGGIYNWEGTATAWRSQIYGNLPDNCIDVTGCIG
jgi:predicted outer membrane repeat protein